jgi:Amt family ammonium transporter
MASIIIGALAGVVCFTAVSVRAKTSVDDSLDVFGVHGIGGTLGALLTGVFATKLINSAGNDGLLYGNASQLGVQAAAVVATWIYAAIMTFVLLKVLDAIMGLRVSDHGEDAGLDVDQHGESAYTMESVA